jgi:hypothetical protein
VRVARKGGLGANFIWLADMQESLKEPLYIDVFHYTAPMSRRIAALLAKEIAARGLARGGNGDQTQVRSPE